MSDDFFYELYGNDEYEEAMDGPHYQFKPPVHKPVTCKYCNINDLVWHDDGTFEKPKWRLYEIVGPGRIEIHVCRKETT